MPSSRSAIIFGAAGGVGSSVALYGQQEGLQINLAMRDTTKPISKLDGVPAFRVHADLTDPESIKKAVSLTKAELAFVYVVHGSKDGMKSAFEALKESGIKFAVLLSSAGVEGNADKVPPSEIVPYIHARAEISLNENFGENGVAVRPAHFASNALFSRNGVLEGEVKLPNPDGVCDWISPDDIGHVCALILARGSTTRVVGLFGPEQLSIRNAFGLIGNATGKDIKITKLTKEQLVESSQAMGLSKEAAAWFYDTLNGPRADVRSTPGYTENVGNVQKWTGKPAIKFEQWVEENKGLFMA